MPKHKTTDKPPEEDGAAKAEKKKLPKLDEAAPKEVTEKESGKLEGEGKEHDDGSMAESKDKQKKKESKEKKEKNEKNLTEPEKESKSRKRKTEEASNKSNSKKQKGEDNSSEELETEKPSSKKSRSKDEEKKDKKSKKEKKAEEEESAEDKEKKAKSKKEKKTESDVGDMDVDTTETSATTGGWNNWSNASFNGDEEKKDKFLRLLGAKKNTSATSSATAAPTQKKGLYGSLEPRSSSGGFVSAIDSDVASKVATDLEKQFQDGVKLKKQQYGGRKGGLGFGA